MTTLNTFKLSCFSLAMTQTVAMPLYAATIPVDSTSDTQAAGICTLRAAITAANTNVAVDSCIAGSLNGRDIIDLSGLPNTSTIILKSELPSVTSALSMNGPGQNNLTVSGNNRVRIISVRDGGDLIVSSMALSNGYSTECGGAINTNLSTLTINNSTLSNNSSYGDGGGVCSASSVTTISNSTLSNNSSRDGGGISSSSSTTTINNSTVSNNSATFGGGVSCGFSSTTTIDNSTLSNNHSTLGGGIYSNSGSTTTLTNSTVSDNSASLDGGGILVFYSTLTLNNIIVAGNTAAFAGNEIHTTGINTLSIRNNLLGNSQSNNLSAFDGFTPDNSNIIATSDGINLQLAQIIKPLADNGGTTLTHGLTAGSPALNAGDNAICPTTDQRGEPRDDGACDIGAFEGGLIDDEETFFVVPLSNGKAVIFDL